MNGHILPASSLDGFRRTLLSANIPPSAADDVGACSP